MDVVFLFILCVFFLYLFYRFEYFVVCLIRAIINGYKDKPYNRNKGKPIIGIFGDSTGVGVGASKPENSLGGIIGRHYPKSTIINKAVNAYSVKKTIKVLEKEDKFDLIILCCVGIDILYFRNFKNIKKDLSKLFTIANKKSDNILYITPLNVGLSTIVPWFLKKYFLNKSKKIGLFIEKEILKYPNIVVENNLLIEHDCLVPNFDKISALDRIHPNNLGYLWVYYKIKTRLPKLIYN